MDLRRTGRFRRMASAGLAPLVAGALLVAMPVSARATITPDSVGQQIAGAINATGASVTGSFTANPNSNADAFSTTSLATFPTDGGSYGILTTGTASSASNAPQS